VVNKITAIALDIDGVLTDGRVTYNEKGEESKTLSYRDIDAVFEFRRRGVTVVLLTAEKTPWVDFLAKRLEVSRCYQGEKNKAEALRRMMRGMSLDEKTLAYIGDSDRDAPALKLVKWGLAPSNATALAKKAARRVLKSAGGQGAVWEALTLLCPPPVKK